MILPSFHKYITPYAKAQVNKNYEKKFLSSNKKRNNSLSS